MFRIEKSDNGTSARTGVLSCHHGVVPTPLFMPVGTAGTVKGVLHDDLKGDLSAGMILANTYHLYLRPGIEVLKGAGGLHAFMNWDGPLLTDSGGYQVFSLSSNRKLSPEGALFRSHIDGSRHLFTPELVVDIQRVIGADFIMVFDECTPYPCSRQDAERSMSLTHQWLHRSVARFNSTSPLWEHDQTLLPIVQGSVFPDLRRESARSIVEMDLPGNAIGGLSVGEPAELMYEMVEVVNEILPESKPRYLMGVGRPENILEAIALGVDMFDCVMPTRNARNGTLFTTEGVINIRNRRWASDFSPIDSGIEASVSNSFSRAYLRHLIMSGEITGMQIASMHNLAFYNWLTTTARSKIEEGVFAEWKRDMVLRVSKRL